MDQEQNRIGDDRWTVTRIRAKIAQIVNQVALKSHQREDLEQELFAHLYARLHAFDASRGSFEAFLLTVVKHRLASLMRHDHALKRYRRHIVSLHTLVRTADGESIELGATIGEKEYRARTGRFWTSDEEVAQRCQDVGDVIAQLPPKLRMLAERLQHQTISQIARDLAVRPSARWGRAGLGPQLSE